MRGTSTKRPACPSLASRKGTLMPSETTRHQITPDEVSVILDGPVPERVRSIAQEKVSSATRLSGRDILEAGVTLRELSNRSSPEPSRAEVMLRIRARSCVRRPTGVPRTKLWISQSLGSSGESWIRSIAGTIVLAGSE